MRDERDTVLVVVQLSGGNDGLNTVVPYEDDEYARNRPTIRQPPNELHKIDSLMGFHPRVGLTGLSNAILRNTFHGKNQWVNQQPRMPHFSYQA